MGFADGSVLELSAHRDSRLARAIVHRVHRETHVLNAAESLVGTYFIPLLRDGLVSRSVDATQDRVEVKLDVTLGGGPSLIRVRYRRIVPQGLQVKPAVAA